MDQKRDRLDRLQIPRTCPVDWEEMAGDERVRFCSECNKNVYNLSAMTRRQAEAVIATARGRLCVRFTRLPDGTTLTADDFVAPPPALHEINCRRALPIATTILSAVLTVGPAISAKALIPDRRHASAVSLKGRNKAKAPTQDVGAKISGTVFDIQQAVIANAAVTLIDEASSETRKTRTGEEGTFQFENLPVGSYILKIESPGFRLSETHGINLQQQDQHINVTMDIARTLQGEIVLPTQTLRVLYNQSDRIVIATVGKSKVTETVGDRSLYKTKLQVSSTLKGAHQPVVYVYHWAYDSQREEFSTGKRLLLFLQKQPEEETTKDGYVVDNSDYRVKQLSKADLQVYVERIEEMAKLAQGEKSNPAQIVEWLVRCVENPATRFEGAYEITRDAEELESQKEDESDQEKSDQKSDEKQAEPQAKIENDEPLDSSNLAAMLTKAQKEHLMDILFATGQLDQRDYQLIKLAQVWKEPRLTPFLVSQLRKTQDGPAPIARRLIEVLTEIFDDDDLKDLSEEYEKIVQRQADLDDEEQGRNKNTDRIEWQQERSRAVKNFLDAVEKKLSQEKQQRS